MFAQAIDYSNNKCGRHWVEGIHLSTAALSAQVTKSDKSYICMPALPVGLCPQLDSEDNALTGNTCSSWCASLAQISRGISLATSLAILLSWIFGIQGFTDILIMSYIFWVPNRRSTIFLGGYTYSPIPSYIFWARRLRLTIF